MARRIAIGAAWWLAAAYAFQLGAFMYGLPAGVGALAAIPVALLVAATLPQTKRRSADRRRIYQPKPEAAPSGEPAILGR